MWPRYQSWLVLFGSPQRIIKGTGGHGNKRTRGDHPSYNVIENGQNTEKNHGDLRRLAVTQTSVEPSANIDVKNSQGVNNNNNNNNHTPHNHYVDNIKLFTKNEKEFKSKYREWRYTVRIQGWKRQMPRMWELPKKRSERSEKRKLTSTWKNWKQTPSNKWRWKKNIKRASQEKEKITRN